MVFGCMGFVKVLNDQKLDREKLAFVTANWVREGKFDGGFLVYEGNEKGYSWWVRGGVRGGCKHFSWGK